MAITADEWVVYLYITDTYLVPNILKNNLSTCSSNQLVVAQLYHCINEMHIFIELCTCICSKKWLLFTVHWVGYRQHLLFRMTRHTVKLQEISWVIAYPPTEPCSPCMSSLEEARASSLTDTGQLFSLELSSIRVSTVLVITTWLNENWKIINTTCFSSSKYWNIYNHDSLFFSSKVDVF